MPATLRPCSASVSGSNAGLWRRCAICSVRVERAVSRGVVPVRVRWRERKDGVQTAGVFRVVARDVTRCNERYDRTSALARTH